MNDLLKMEFYYTTIFEFLKFSIINNIHTEEEKRKQSSDILKSKPTTLEFSL